MIITQRGVLAPVQVAELDAAIVSSLLSPGGARLVGRGDLSRVINSYTNAGVITVLAANTVIITTGAVAYALDELIWVNAGFSMTKGGTDGDNLADVRFTSGTGTLLFIDGTPIHACGRHNVGAGLNYQDNVGGVARCTVAGTVTTELIGASGGSNSTVGVLGAGLGLWRLLNT